MVLANWLSKLANLSVYPHLFERDQNDSKSKGITAQ